MIVVTGGSGFIGSYLLYYLIEKYGHVRAIRRQNSNLSHTQFIFRELFVRQPLPGFSGWEEIFNRVEWVYGDILDTPSLEDAFSGADTVYHAAAIVSFSRRKRAIMMRTNVEGTANVVNIAIEKDVRKIAYLSSVAALARKPGKMVGEVDKPDDLKFASAYSESKFRAEMEVWRGVAEGLEAAVINPGIVLGWGNFNSGSSELFKTVNTGLKFYPVGSNAYVDARDVARALIFLAENDEAKNRRFIALSENISYFDLFAKISKAMGKKKPFIKAGMLPSLGVWAFAEAEAFLTRTDPFITKDMAITACKNYSYDNSALLGLGFSFRSIDETIIDTSESFFRWIIKNT